MLRTFQCRPLVISATPSLIFRLTASRALSTLSSNPHVHIFSDPSRPSSHALSLLATSPPNPALALGTTATLPPDPEKFKTNEKFISILNAVLAEHAHSDKSVQSQAAALASSSGSWFTQPNRRQGAGGGGASDQGGAGGGGVGGWVHVSDLRKPPDFGRIADPEDIMGSLEVDSDGKFTDGHGRYQASGTYRIVTNDGVLGLTDFLREKLVERLKLMEANEQNKK